jgi:murein DD-endopeptidase MepM/ murein hydrolase activator NlpD
MRTVLGTALAMLLCGACSSKSSGDDDDAGAPPDGGGDTVLGRHSETISPGGGTVTLEGYASVTFAAGAFPADQLVTVEASRTAETERLFDDSAAIFQPGAELAYEVRIDTGDVATANDAQVAIVVPATLAAGADERLEAFAQFFEGSELDSNDAFELVRSTHDAAAGTIDLALPPTAFTAERRSDHAFEAVVTLAATPGAVPQAGLAAATGVCMMRKPLEAVSVISAFNPNRCVTVRGREYCGHFGTDLVAGNGTPTYAVSDGTAIRAEFSGDDPSNYPSGGGHSFGNTIVWRTPHAGVVRYAHLQEYLPNPGDTALAGQLIGSTDTTGTVTGPHLHFELAPDGRYWSDKSKADPAPCFTDDRLPWRLEAEATYDSHSTDPQVVDTWSLTMRAEVDLEYESSDASGITLRLTGGTFTMVSYSGTTDNCTRQGTTQVYPITPSGDPVEGATVGGLELIWLRQPDAAYDYGGAFITGVLPPVTEHCDTHSGETPLPTGMPPWFITADPQRLDVMETAVTGNGTFDISVPGSSAGMGTLHWTLTKLYQSF